MKDASQASWRVYTPGAAILAVVVIATAFWAVGRTAGKPGPTPRPKDDAPGRSVSDGGLGVALTYVPPIRDPQSLEEVRGAFHHIGYRGIASVEKDLARGGLTPKEELEALWDLALLNLYEGEFARAGEVLARARAKVVADPERFRGELPTILLVQGIAALRLGETENCVECRGQGSCIFPLAKTAIHQKPRGSRGAIAHFTEYLQREPDDLGVRWLLNVAYMTLGEYPGRVPPSYLIPLSAFQSEFDIGRFVDVAPRLGLDRLHRAGGAIMDDFDNDGLLDVVETSMDPGRPMTLFRNRGDGTFEDRTKAAGLLEQLGGLHCPQADFNNDGWLDIFICRGAWTKVPVRPSLLRNNRDGTFTDVTREAGLNAPVDSQVAAWADYDNDGFLDLYVGAETVLGRLYHNRGDGTFEDVTLASRVVNDGGYSKGANWGDFDGDGAPDLYLANLNGPPLLFHNNRNGTFAEVASSVGIHGPLNGFSCWWWDFDNDGRLDLFATSYDRTLSDVIASHLGQPPRRETCRLYRNLAGRGFEDVTRAAGLDLVMAPMGTNFADFDNDGFLDFYLGTGDPNYSMLTPNRMFKNVDGKRFADITTSSGTGHLQKGHAVAIGDWDRDGDVDLFEQMGGAIPGDKFRSVLFQNPGQGHHWITVKLVGKKTNRAAIGARIKITPAGEPARTIYRDVTSGSSFGANPLQQTIGIGEARGIATLEVDWPTSGTHQAFREVPIDRAIEINEFEPAFRVLPGSRIDLPTE